MNLSCLCTTHQPDSLSSEITITKSNRHSSSHHPSHQPLSKKPKSACMNQIPYEFTKYHPKNTTKLHFISQQTGPSAVSFGLFGAVPRKPEIKTFKKNTKLLQINKKLTHLSLAIKTNFASDLHYALSRLRYLQNITSLDLAINSRNDLTLPNIKILCHILVGLKNLTTFSIQTPECFKIPFQFITSICSALRCLPSLSHLSFQFNSPRDFGDDYIQKLASHISSFSQLKSFSFDIPKPTEISEIGLQSLSFALKRLPLLTEVSIRYPYSGGTSAKAFQDIFSSLATLKSLKKLDIAIKPDPTTCKLNEAEPYSLGLDLLNGSQFSEISLKLYEDMTDKGLDMLSKSLARFSSLKILDVDFSLTSFVSDTSISHFASSFPNLVSLSSLGISSIGRSLLPQTIPNISKNIVSLKELTNLSLDFSNSSGEKSAIHTLSSSLQQLSLLRKLNLNLSLCPDFMDDDALASLSTALQTLKDLTNLTLDLSFIADITNQGLKALLLSLSELPKLTDFTLKLESNKIDGETLKMIGQSLQDFPALYFLDLKFVSHNPENVKEGVQGFSESLHRVVPLRDVQLEISFAKVYTRKIESLKKLKFIAATSFKQTTNTWKSPFQK